MREEAFNSVVDGHLNRPGALVLSLDFELAWGVRDHCKADSPYRSNLVGARRAIPAMLELFKEFEVAATWATVGFLFASSREELMEYSPTLRPSYRNPAMNPYADQIGDSEQEDPLHFAPSLIEQIQCCPNQEIGCHSYSHFYCQEPGATLAAFRADVESAVRLARQRNIQLASFVFPRNQVLEESLQVLSSFGFTSYRGAERGWMHRTTPGLRNHAHRRLARLVDQHWAPSSRLVSWTELKQGSTLCDVRGSLFLRPFTPAHAASDELRIRRIAHSLKRAAQEGKILHVWWHPHNFGRDTELNVLSLRRILQTFAECRDRFGMQSLNMAGVAAVRQQQVPPVHSLLPAPPASVMSAA